MEAAAKGLRSAGGGAGTPAGVVGPLEALQRLHGGPAAVFEAMVPMLSTEARSFHCTPPPRSLNFEASYFSRLGRNCGIRVCYITRCFFGRPPCYEVAQSRKGFELSQPPYLIDSGEFGP